MLRALQKKPGQRLREPGADFALELSEISRQAVSPEPIVSDGEKLDALKRVEALAELSEAELREIAKVGALVAGQGQPTSSCGRDDPGSHFFLLAAGSAKVVRRERLLNLINEGEFFGEMAYVLGRQQPRHATVVAMKDVLLAEFKPDALARISLGRAAPADPRARPQPRRAPALANTRLTG